MSISPKAHISLVNTKILFGKSGFKCAICSCSLERGEKHIAEQAHIYGEKPGAARYDPTQSPDFVNSHKNLILLCPTCHTLIDKEPIGEWSVEKLFETKRLHEQRISNLQPVPEPRLIVKVIETFHQALDNIEIDEEFLAPTTRPTADLDYLKEIKNPRNEMAQNYADYLCSIYLKNTRYIDDFLANPNNTETAKRLQGIVKKINKKLFAENEGKLTASYFEKFCEETINSHPELNGEREETLSVILFYLYWHCDIGLR